MTTATRERFAIADMTGGELNALVKKVGGADQARQILRDDYGVVLTTLTPKNLKQPGSLDDLRDRFDKALALLVKPEVGNKAWHGSLNKHLVYIKSCLNLGFPKMPNEFQVWKTIKLGTGLKKADDFRKAIKAAGMKIGDWANDILGKPAFTASETEQDVDLVVATPKELGFTGNATYKDICAKAIELGLELCPAEVGPQLRKQYTDQPKDEWLVIAMEPIAGSRGPLACSASDTAAMGCGSALAAATLAASGVLTAASCLSVASSTWALEHCDLSVTLNFVLGTAIFATTLWRIASNSEPCTRGVLFLI